MTTENLIGADRLMDVREIPCATKHPLIVKTFVELPVGGHFILLNGRDPRGECSTSSPRSGRGRSPGNI